MPSETKPLRLRKPTPKTIDHLELGAPTPSKWKHAVKVDLRKLEAYLSKRASNGPLSARWLLTWWQSP